MSYGYPITVRLSYSTDDGATWLPATPLDVIADEYSCIVVNELAIEQKFAQARRIRRVFTGRAKITLRVSERNFGARHDTSDAKFIAVQDWLRQPLLRIWTHDGAATPAGVNIDGRSYFASASNTNYVVPDEGEEGDVATAFRKSFTLELVSSSTV